MNRTAKVFLACAIGALVGSLVALQFKLFWWVGLLAGGLTGYLPYEFGTVIRMIPRAWRMATSWRMSWRNIGIFFLDLLTYLVVMPIAVTLLVAPYLAIFFFVCLWSLRAACLLAFGLIFFVGFINGFGMWFEKKNKDGVQSKEVLSYLQKFNIVVIAIKYLPSAILWFLSCIPRGITVVCTVFAKFVWHLFRLIHSEERVLCAVNAGIGTIVGFIAGNALVGAFAGGILGVFSYEILSKRVFHFVPMRKSSN